MTDEKINTGSKIVVSIVFFSLISTLMILYEMLKVDAGIFNSLFLLPLGHAIICMILYSIPFANYLTIILVAGGYTIRNVLTPLFFSLGGFEYFGRNAIHAEYATDVEKTIFLMLYETLVVFIVLYCALKNEDKQIVSSVETNNKSFDKHVKVYSAYSFFIYLIFLLLIVSIYMVPDISSSFRSLISEDAVELTSSISEIENYNPGSSGRLMYSFFILFFPIAQFVISMYLIIYINKASNGSAYGFALAACIIFLNVFFVTEENALTVFLLVSLLLFSKDVFSRQKLLVESLGAGIVLFAVISLFTLRITNSDTRDVSTFSIVGSFLNAYVPGFLNVSPIWHTHVPSRFVTLYYDFYMSIPLRSIIPPLFEGNRLSYYFNDVAKADFQITPLCAQSFFYFNIFGVAIQVFFVSLAIKCERKYKKANTYINLLAFLTGTIFLSTAGHIYSLTSILSGLWRIVIPLIVLSVIHDYSLKEKESEFEGGKYLLPPETR